ncbi:MAG TPA: EAL domain-containing protein [Verrucomicrobiae bacterium]|nr:EAL domain-containing protein [Verrucomicrobiae bacterium]
MSAVPEEGAPLVLLVDDNPLQRKNLEIHLKRAGYRVTCAASAAAALRAAELQTPAVILSDVMMPGTDGFLLCRALRRNLALRTVPVVLMSGHYGETLDLRHAANCGANMFVSRAQGPAALVRGVADALRNPAMRLEPISDAALDAEHSVRVSRQLDRLNAAHEAAIRDSERDALTGLAHRAAFKKKLDDATASVVGSPNRAAVLLVSLANFREVNDALGPDGGDRLLIETASRLRQVAGLGVPCARLGTAEFGVLLPRFSDEHELARISGAILVQLAQPIPIQGISVEMRPCVGAAQCPDDAALGSELLRRASVALHYAQDRHLSFSRYSAEQDPFCVQQLVLAAELRQAVDRNELELWYQPKLDLATGSVEAVEALVRWRHPTRGLVPPDDFIPIAENIGLICRITRWVLREALQQARRWRDSGLNLSMSINVTQSDLREPTFEREVLHAIVNAGVPPGSVTIEITESAAMREPERVMQALGALRERGVRISLDDFGIGQASLAHLHSLPVDEIKLDKSFVLNLPDAHSRSIAGAAALLARELGLKSVAEGMETAESHVLLEKMGFTSVQGFHLSKPLPAAGIVAWINGRAIAPGSKARACRA